MAAVALMHTAITRASAADTAVTTGVGMAAVAVMLTAVTLDPA